MEKLLSGICFRCCRALRLKPYVRWISFYRSLRPIFGRMACMLATGALAFASVAHGQAIEEGGQVAAYDLQGHEVAILVVRSESAGNYTVRFGAGNLPSGVYVYRLQAQDKTIVRTMMPVK